MLLACQSALIIGESENKCNIFAAGLHLNFTVMCHQREECDMQICQNAGLCYFCSHLGTQ